MEVTINNPIVENFETIYSSGNADKIRGISSAKSFKTWLDSRINLFRKRNNLEMTFALEGVKQAYLKFHPEIVKQVDLESWKGKGDFQIIDTPEYFEITEWRKSDEFSEPKEIHHKLYKSSFNQVYKAFQSIELNKKYKTSEFAEIWCRINHIWENADGNRIIENKFDYARISGCRETYFQLYYSIKVLEKFYGVILYEKSGNITKIKEELE